MNEGNINEEWVEITGFPNYLISNKGRVKRISRLILGKSGSKYKLPEKIMSPVLSKAGYPSVLLTIGEAKLNFKIHRLVAKAFIPNPENKPQVNHKNGIKTDNNVDNLEWATASENVTHAFKTGLSQGKKGEANNSSKLTEREVLQIRHLFAMKVFDMEELSKKYKVTNKTIFNIVTRRVWKHI